MSQGTGSDIKISKTQIRKTVRQGGSLWGSLISLGSKLLPMAMPLAKKAIAPLATGALSGLASLGVDKIFRKGQRGGFLIPIDKIAQLQTFNDHGAEKRIFLRLFKLATDWLSDRQKHRAPDFLVL